MNHHEIKNQLGELLDHQFHRADRMDRLVILGHGLTGTKDRPLLVALAEGLAACGWPCMRVSFSGNGNSGGRFEDSNITKQIADLRAVLDVVPDYVRIIYIGHSMGAAVGVLTAVVDLRIRALVSLAGMTHTADFVAREFGGAIPGEDLMWDEPGCPLSKAFVDDLNAIGSTLPAAARVMQPWFLIHGTADDVVPVGDGRDAWEAANCNKRWLEIPGAGHMFGEESYPQIVAALDDWLSALFVKSA